MLPRKFFILFFTLMCLVQWLVPSFMIYQHHDALTSGTVFKFETMPVDPVDFFRGRYVQLRFKENSVMLDSLTKYRAGEQVYALLSVSENGFANIRTLSRQKPLDADDFVEVVVDYIYQDSIPKATISFPFERYYMQEFKAPLAETALNEAFKDSLTLVYAVVRVKRGISSLEDVIINEKSINHFIETVPQK